MEGSHHVYGSLISVECGVETVFYGVAKITSSGKGVWLYFNSPPPHSPLKNSSLPPCAHRKFGHDCLRIVVGVSKLANKTVSFIEIKILVVKVLGNSYNKEKC